MKMLFFFFASVHTTSDPIGITLMFLSPDQYYLEVRTQYFKTLATSIK